MELVPQPLALLLRRLEIEPGKTGGALFDLPADKMWSGTPAGFDFSRSFHGEKSSTTVGPAAGPHTQLAQNIALSYLAGSRILELKTVQILDELKIPRPCIDATNIGFNVEWSQELKVEQSTLEYPKAALLVAALKREGFPNGLDASKDGDYLLDLSLGYDLKGIQSEKITGFVKNMLDASAIIDRLTDELPKSLSRFRDLAVAPKLISCVTLSTFHGCPAHEIESIARYLLEEVGVHTVVKLNPTLLGYDDVRHLLHEELGYRELEVDRHAFEHDLLWDDALAMIGRLRAIAHAKKRVFGVKLTNTLVVKNHKDFFPATEKAMYLSGQPLHVLSTQLLARLRRALPLLGEGGAPPVAYSFSAGVDQHNFPLAVAADLCPVTTCTDLLRPGGYGRLPKYMESLASSMKKVGATELEGYTLAAYAEGAAALAAIADPTLAEARRLGVEFDESSIAALKRTLVDGRPPLEALTTAGVPRALAEIAAPLWLHEAGTRNAAHVAKAALEDPRYKKEKNTKVPKKIGSKLELFDCVNCDKCVPVCPNDANFVYDVAPLSAEAPTWTFAADRVEVGPSIKVEIEASHQLATFVDSCNACGNCDVFCPEDGGPYVMKPHWFGSKEACEAETLIEGFYLESADAIAGRWGGRRVRLEARPDRLCYEDEAVVIEAALDNGAVRLLSHRLKGEAGHKVEAGQLVILAALLSGIRSTVNPVSVAFADPSA